MKIDPIEGATPLDPSEAEGLLAVVETQGELNREELLAVTEAQEWASRRRWNLDRVLDFDFVFDLHRRMFGEVWDWAGKLRKTEKSIGVPPTQILEALKMLNDDAKFWVEHETFSKEEIAVRYHHRLVWIHPFTNGNGRLARLATEVLCKVLRIGSPSWKSFDLVNKSEVRTEYIQALQAADKGDFGELIRFMFAEASE